jgi:hypothetical protein
MRTPDRDFARTFLADHWIGRWQGIPALASGMIGRAQGWQWVVIVTGFPAVLLGFVTLAYLDDSHLRGPALIRRRTSQRTQPAHASHSTFKIALPEYQNAR